MQQEQQKVRIVALNIVGWMVHCSQLRPDLILCCEISPDSFGDVGQLTSVERVWVVALGLHCCDGNSRSLT